MKEDKSTDIDICDEPLPTLGSPNNVKTLVLSLKDLIDTNEPVTNENLLNVTESTKEFGGSCGELLLCKENHYHLHIQFDHQK